MTDDLHPEEVILDEPADDDEPEIEGPRTDPIPGIPTEPPDDGA